MAGEVCPQPNARPQQGSSVSHFPIAPPRWEPMPRITVDGIDYAPATEQPASVGVAITTRNRPDALAKCLAAYRHHTPAGVPILVIDDASDTPVESDFRFERNVGIATAKNKCIELLMAAGVEHLFLSDDDAYPIAPNWWTPYIDSPERHLFAVFSTPTAKSSRIETLYRDDQHVSYHATRGYFLYLHKSVVEKVGGLDIRFRNAFEHVEYSNRIHNAGLTTWPYQDVAGSENLIFCADSKPGNTSAIPDATRRANEQIGLRLLQECEGRTDFVPFGTRDVVLSCLFAGQPDPQRNTHLKPDTKLAAALLKSLNGIDTVVLCDFPTDEPQFEEVPASLSPYIQRWISYRQWLVRHPEVRYVWCVDATDVENLQNPFADMQPGTLYTGWENQIVGCEWMLTNHQASRPWIEQNANKPLLNAGVAGGDRATMLELCRRIIALWTEATMNKLSDKAGDMAYYNRAAHDMHAVTGPRITTLFKANQRSDFSLWKHK